MGNLSRAVVLAEKGHPPPGDLSVITVISVIHDQMASVNSCLLYSFLFLFFLPFLIALWCKVQPFFYVVLVCGRKLEGMVGIGHFGAGLFCVSCELVCIFCPLTMNSADS